MQPKGKQKRLRWLVNWMKRNDALPEGFEIKKRKRPDVEPGLPSTGVDITDEGTVKRGGRRVTGRNEQE